MQGAATDQPDPADNAALRRGHSVFQPVWQQIDQVLIAVHVANVHGDCFPAHDIHRPELKGHVPVVIHFDKVHTAFAGLVRVSPLGIAGVYHNGFLVLEYPVLMNVAECPVVDVRRGQVF